MCGERDETDTAQAQKIYTAKVRNRSPSPTASPVDHHSLQSLRSPHSLRFCLGTLLALA